MTTHHKPGWFVSALTVALIVAGMCLPAVLFWQASQQQQQTIDDVQGQLDEANDRARALSIQLDSVTVSLAKQQNLSVCRVGISKTVDLAILEYLRQYGGVSTTPDTALVAAAIQNAIVAREDTEKTCAS